MRAKLIEPGYGYLRVVQFQEHTGEDVAKALRELYKQGELTGLVLDLRSDPGGLLNVSGRQSAAAFLPQDALVVLHRWPHTGRADAPLGDQGRLHAWTRR